MAGWKQSLIAICVIGLAAFGFLRFYPGAQDLLASLGLGSVAPSDQAASGTERGRGAGGPRGAGTGGGRGGFGADTPIVVAEPAGRGVVNDRLSAIGTGKALQSVAVLPYSAGRLTAIKVKSSDHVQTGDVIATLDADVETIAVDRARIQLEDAEARLKRASALRSSSTVTAVTLTDAELAAQNAKLELRQAELSLERRQILAPISGIVGILPVNIGDYVTSQTEIVTLDDRTELQIDFWVPERFAGVIKVGDKIEAGSIAQVGVKYDGEVSAVDNRIDATSRTLHVQATIANPGDNLRAGMSFEIGMRFPGEDFPSVNPLSIQWSTDGAYVWTVNDGKATRVPVEIVQRNSSSVLVNAQIADGLPVIVEGVQLVRDGAAVKLAGEGREKSEKAALAAPGDS